MEHQQDQPGNDEGRLNVLFQAYRAACPDIDGSADFMPRLWQKIESRQGVTLLFGRWARNLATAALGLSMLLGLAVTISTSRTNTLPSESYVELLAEEPDNASLDLR